ncbi:MAG: DUF4175 family protein [Endomicrobiales bacterium]|nr:DUF4175 family protein [Endomicrobiales bacterium]
MKKIIEFVNSARLSVLISSFIQYLLYWLSVSLLLYLVWSISDYIFLLRVNYRKLFYLFIILWGIYCIFRYLQENIKYLKDQAVILLIQKRIKELGDELISSWQLHFDRPVGVSDELVSRLIDDVENKLNHFSPNQIINYKAVLYKPLRYFAVLCLAFLFLYLLPPYPLEPSYNRILLSFSASNWESWFYVKPGTKNLPHASSVRVVVGKKIGLKGNPRLFMKNENIKWKEVDLKQLCYETGNEPDAEKGPVSVKGGQFAYKIDKLTDKLQYYVVWGDLETQVFELVPVMYPQLGEFEISYRYPEYTGLTTQVIKGNPNISALSGTVVNISAKASKNLKRATLSINGKINYPVALGKTRPSGKFLSLNEIKKMSEKANEGNFIITGFEVKKSGYYKFFFETDDNINDPEPSEYIISVIEDQLPGIELISPQEDLVVSDDSVIPMVIQASDDFGLTRIDLHYRIEDRKDEKIDIPFGKDENFQKIFEYSMKISKLNLKSPEKMHYYFEAWDNDTVNGPKSSVTSTYLIETTDYEVEHEKIEKELKGFREELLNILADQTMAKEKLNEVNTNFSSSTYNKLLEEQKSIKEKVEVPNNMLDKLLSAMENDPYTDFSTYSEYHGLKSHLEYLKDEPMSEALKAIEKKDWEKAGKNQDEIIASLEKMSLLAEDIWQYQKMRDLIDSGTELSNAGSDLLDQLSGTPRPEELNRTLDKIQELMQEINKQISKLPKELPEDFINSPAIESIDLQQSQSLVDELSKAIEEGDWEKAKKLAESLKEQLSNILNTLDEVGQNVGFSKGAVSQMQKKVDKYNTTINEIITEQKDLNQGIEEMDIVRRKNLFKKQEKLLEDLAKRQRTVVDKSMRISVKTHEYHLNFDKTINLMKKVLEEFEKKRVYNSQKYLEDIIKDLDRSAKIIAGRKDSRGKTSNNELHDDILFLSKEENDILNLLKNPGDSGLFSETDKNALKSLSKKEDDIMNKTTDLRHSLEEFFRQSTSVKPEVFQNLFNAETEMKKASQQITDKKTQDALESGQKALEYLQNGQSGLKSASDYLSGQENNAGKPISSPIKTKTYGIMGFREEPVRLPDINEYKPPREFRQEIIDALKEKYPKQYEQIIKDYYKRLTE